jgi:hypothetical protein
MSKLIELDPSYCGIDDEGIKDLKNIIKLNAYNKNITNVNHMEKLIELNANNNKKITNINYMLVP